LAHAATATTHGLRIALGTIRLRRKSGVLGGQMILTAGGAPHCLGFFAPAHQPLKLGPAIIASVFENRHVYKLAGFELTRHLR
jgi:hypothetical protein